MVKKFKKEYINAQLEKKLFYFKKDHIFEKKYEHWNEILFSKISLDYTIATCF